MNTEKLITIVIPCYNEANNICLMVSELEKVFSDLPYRWEMLFVDDGSTDSTLKTLTEIFPRTSNLRYISFSRNFGKEAALKAGYDHARGDAVISLDADLQHPPSIIPEMIRLWEEGYEVVCTQRAEDHSLPWMKRATSKLFYQLLNKLCSINLRYGVSDFRLLNRNVVDIIKMLPEKDLFFSGIVKWTGFRQASVDYYPNKRLHGISRYNLSKLLILAIDSIVSFSIRPLYYMVFLGLIFSCLSLSYIPYLIYCLLFSHSLSTWFSILAAVFLFGGLHLSITGLVGIYAGKSYEQAKQRPQYIIAHTRFE
ncbi:MAG: glycosyltransferase family 2 protein [Bacteroidales bacterium]|jgi:dolichol-phosphate mannosyltransferase|nr:glycosyltransferase family 2 protein [Bacteroidales bacterium]